MSIAATGDSFSGYGRFEMDSKGQLRIRVLKTIYSEVKLHPPPTGNHDFVATSAPPVDLRNAKDGQTVYLKMRERIHWLGTMTFPDGKPVSGARLHTRTSPILSASFLTAGSLPTGLSNSVWPLIPHIGSWSIILTVRIFAWTMPFSTLNTRAQKFREQESCAADRLGYRRRGGLSRKQTPRSSRRIELISRGTLR